MTKIIFSKGMSWKVLQTVKFEHRRLTVTDHVHCFFIIILRRFPKMLLHDHGKQTCNLASEQLSCHQTVSHDLHGLCCPHVYVSFIYFYYLL